MTECDMLPTCIFYTDRMDDMPATAELMKQQYCLGEFETCARHRVEAKLGRECVPESLFPDDSAFADRIVAGT